MRPSLRFLSVSVLPVAFASWGCAGGDDNANSDRAGITTTPYRITVGAPLSTTAAFIGDGYRCEIMMDWINVLQPMGREKALAALEKYLADDRAGRNYDILLLCRLLFVNPKGWQPLMLGSPVPFPKADGIVKFPSYPIAFSDGYPFLLVRGYQLGGRGPSPVAALDECRPYELIKDDYPKYDRDKAIAAAKKLIESRDFKQLYLHPEDVQEMGSFILRQAQLLQ